MTVAWFAKIGPTYEANPETVYYWSGTGVITINVGDGLQTYSGTTVNGTQLINLRSISDSQSEKNRRASITITLPDTPDRAPFLAALVDPGPVQVKINWAVTHNQGQTWTILNRAFVGKLSKPSVTQNVYMIDIETLRGADRFGGRQSVNFESQRNAYPSYVLERASGNVTVPEDDSLFMMPVLGAQGVRTRWPNNQ